MTIDINTLQSNLCSAMCAQINVRRKNDRLIAIDTPFTFPDGDVYQLYLKERPTGVLRLSDNGHTLLHMSYENDINSFKEGTRGVLFNKILTELDVVEDDGELYIDTTINDIIPAVFKIGQAITKISDLTFLNRIRVETTFYEDFERVLSQIIPPDFIQKNYYYPDLQNSKDYPIDYFIKGKNLPLFMFGIPGKDKARLATIILEHFLREKIEFESLLVFLDQSLIPKGDLARLINVGGEMISSLDAYDDMKRKVVKRIGFEPLS